MSACKTQDIKHVAKEKYTGSKAIEPNGSTWRITTLYLYEFNWGTFKNDVCVWQASLLAGTVNNTSKRQKEYSDSCQWGIKGWKNIPTSRELYSKYWKAWITHGTLFYSEKNARCTLRNKECEIDSAKKVTKTLAWYHNSNGAVFMVYLKFDDANAVDNFSKNLRQNLLKRSVW